MNLGTGRFSAAHASKVMKVAESQNGGWDHRLPAIFTFIMIIQSSPISYDAHRAAESKLHKQVKWDGDTWL